MLPQEESVVSGNPAYTHCFSCFLSAVEQTLRYMLADKLSSDSAQHNALKSLYMWLLGGHIPT